MITTRTNQHNALTYRLDINNLPAPPPLLSDPFHAPAPKTPVRAGALPIRAPLTKDAVVAAFEQARTLNVPLSPTLRAHLESPHNRVIALTVLAIRRPETLIHIDCTAWNTITNHGAFRDMHDVINELFHRVGATVEGVIVDLHALQLVCTQFAAQTGGVDKIFKRVRASMTDAMTSTRGYPSADTFARCLANALCGTGNPVNVEAIHAAPAPVLRALPALKCADSAAAALQSDLEALGVASTWYHSAMTTLGQRGHNMESAHALLVQLVADADAHEWSETIVRQEFGKRAKSSTP